MLDIARFHKQEQEIMKRFILFFAMLLIVANAYCQEEGKTNITNNKEFKVFLSNKEYELIMNINLYEETVTIPGQDIMGQTYGYLKKDGYSQCWIIMGVQFSANGKKATLEIINDWGSDDLTAELSIQKDGSYKLKQLKGSTIRVGTKVDGKSKWLNLPKELIFKRPSF